MLVCSGTGIGKSTFVNEIAYDLLVRQGQTVGVIALEENNRRTAQRFISINLNYPIHIHRGDITDEESKMHLVKPLGLVGYIFTTTLALLMLIPCLIVYGILLLAWVAGSLFSITYQYSYRVWMSLTREKP